MLRARSLARLGGDEFAVTLSGATADEALAYAEEIRRRVATASAAAGLPFTVSLGLATFSGPEQDAEALLARADSALYAAKNSGRDTVRAAPHLMAAS